MLAVEGNKSGKDSLAVIILAAGYSFRMKKFKPLLRLGQCTVVEKAVQNFLNAGIGDVRVVIGHRSNELLPVLDRLGVKSVVNDSFAEGMYSSIACGVKSLEPEIKGFFLLPVDNPVIENATLEKLQNSFFSTNRGIVYPTYQGRRGHPPLISTRYVSKVLVWDKPGGMRALLEQYQADSLNVEVVDQGVMLDMDTPEDYLKMLSYCGLSGIPTEKECFDILISAHTPVRVVKHCEQVARVSCLIGSYINKSGGKVNIELIKAASLLHDIAKGQRNHAQVGAEMLANYPTVAEIVAEHTDICLNSYQPVCEKEIVYLADKLVSEDRIISLRDRFAVPLETYKNDHVAIGSITQRLNNAAMIQRKIEDLLRIPLEYVWQSDLGGETNG